VLKVLDRRATAVVFVVATIYVVTSTVVILAVVV